MVEGQEPATARHGMQAGASPPSSWLPSTGWLRSAKIGQHVFSWGGLFGLYLCFFAAMEAWELPGLLGLVLALPVLFLNAALHELGHLLAARRAGMFVVRAQVGSVELLARRRGWRARWRAPRVRVDGLVMAFPDPREALQPQFLSFAAGGPLANAATGTVLVAIGVAVGPGSGVGLLALGIGLHALALAAANLMPFPQGSLASDGLQLMRHWRGVDDEDPQVAFARANGLAMIGVTADRLDPVLLQRLASAPPPMPLLHLWMTMFAHLNRGEWSQAAALGPHFDAGLAAVPAAEQPGWSDFSNVVRAELRFAAALAGDDDLAGAEAGLPEDDGWYRPTQKPRFRALAAAFAGDEAACRSALADAERAAEDSPDGASRVTEAKLRDAILQSLASRLAPQR